MREDIDLQHFKNRLEDRLADIKKQQDSRKPHAGPVELDQGRVGRLRSDPSVLSRISCA